MEKPIKNCGVGPVVRYSVAQSFLKGEVRASSKRISLLQGMQFAVSGLLNLHAPQSLARVLRLLGRKFATQESAVLHLVESKVLFTHVR